VEEAPVQVKLPVFEGPLDLLLHLIHKNEVDIYDIPVHTITQQYLEYLDLMKALNIEVAGEFLVMAATLIQIKSKMLLPAQESDQEEEDPRMELALPLLEYLRFKEAAQWLEGRPWLERDVFSRGENDDVAPQGQEERPLFNLSLFDLIDAFREVMDRAAQIQEMTVPLETVSLNDRIAELMDLFRTEVNLRFTELFDPRSGLSAVIVTFLAILELARLGFIQIFQEAAFSPIRLASRPEAFVVAEDPGEPDLAAPLGEPL